VTVVHGVELRTERDRIALYVESGRGPYEPETVAAFVEAIENDPHGCVIDVGAYTGLYSMLAVRAGAHEVITLEPNPGGFQRLHENLTRFYASTKTYVDWIVRRWAASSEPGFGRMKIDDEAKGICSTGKLVLDPAGDVEVVRIDDLDRRRPVSVIKIDVEGHELAALSGAAVTLATEAPVLFVEVHSGSGGDRTEPITRFLAGFGYEGQPLDERNMAFRVPPQGG
jgi:FkbM family methyltransferase